MLAIEDPDVASVLRDIRDHACEGIDVPDVLDAVPQSRRRLEYRFKKLLKRTPHEEIVRVRLERVKSLLVASDLSLEKIVHLAGFEYAEYRSVRLPPEVRHAAQRLPRGAKAVTVAPAPSCRRRRSPSRAWYPTSPDCSLSLFANSPPGACIT